jgi:inner membrane protein
MLAEYWLLAALMLTIAEVLAPGVFLIFFALGAVAAAVAARLFGVVDLVWQLAIFVAATILILLAGHSFYRRFIAHRAAEGIGRGPLGEPGIVEEPIVDGRGKVRVRDISWLATGPDLAKGTPIVVVGRPEGTLLEVAPRRHAAPDVAPASSDRS